MYQYVICFMVVVVVMRCSRCCLSHRNEILQKKEISEEVEC